MRFNIPKYILLLLLIPFSFFAQELSADLPVASKNSVLKNFKPFPTARTNDRPGTVYRIASDKKRYTVEDVKSIKSLMSEEETISGRMYFTPEEMMLLLNVEFENVTAIPVEVVIKNAEREYTEQVLVDMVLWENEKLEQIVVDQNSDYFIIRETISSKDITFRFSEDAYSKIISGKNKLTKLGGEDTKLDFPYEIKKKYKEPKRIFYLDQKIGPAVYGETYLR